MAQFITLFNQLAAPEIREPAAGCLIFQVDDIRYFTGVVFTGLNWIGAEAKFSQNIMYIGFVGVNILTQTESGPAPLDEDRRHSGNGGIIVSTAGSH